MSYRLCLSAINLMAVNQIRLQAVEKHGCWFALDSGQLNLCRQLERESGRTIEVTVEVVSSKFVPKTVQDLMIVPRNSFSGTLSPQGVYEAIEDNEQNKNMHRETVKLNHIIDGLLQPMETIEKSSPKKG